MDLGQGAFRVAVRGPPMQSAPHTSLDSPAVFHSRRPHNKSRGGCEGCKKRRRKCDEQKPRCSTCVRKGTVCTYQVNSTQSPRQDGAMVKGGISKLWPGAYSPAILTSDSTIIRHTEHDLFLLDHFVKTTALDFENENNRVYSTSALQLAKQYPFLMHGMIALSACHIQHLGIDASKYRNAEAFHCHFASQGLRNSVGSIVSTNDADAILTTAMLLNTLTFCAASYRDEVPLHGICGNQPRFDWLRIQIGLTDLLMRTQPYRANSIWNRIFTASNDLSVLGPPVNDLGDRLAAFCIKEDEPQSQDDLYAGVIDKLTPVVERDVSPEYLLLYLQPIGAMSTEFVELMEANDTKALVLFAHWLRLMCCIDTWWCVRRTRRECWVICDVLTKRLQDEDLELLRLPATACGYWQRGEG